MVRGGLPALRQGKLAREVPRTVLLLVPRCAAEAGASSGRRSTSDRKNTGGQSTRVKQHASKLLASLPRGHNVVHDQGMSTAEPSRNGKCATKVTPAGPRVEPRLRPRLPNPLYVTHDWKSRCAAQRPAQFDGLVEAAGRVAPVMQRHWNQGIRTLKTVQKLGEQQLRECRDIIECMSEFERFESSVHGKCIQLRSARKVERWRAGLAGGTVEADCSGPRHRLVAPTAGVWDAGQVPATIDAEQAGRFAATEHAAVREHATDNCRPEIRETLAATRHRSRIEAADGRRLLPMQEMRGESSIHRRCLMVTW